MLAERLVIEHNAAIESASTARRFDSPRARRPGNQRPELPSPAPELSRARRRTPRRRRGLSPLPIGGPRSTTKLTCRGVVREPGAVQGDDARLPRAQINHLLPAAAVVATAWRPFPDDDARPARCRGTPSWPCSRFFPERRRLPSDGPGDRVMHSPARRTSRRWPRRRSTALSSSGEAIDSWPTRRGAMVYSSRMVPGCPLLLAARKAAAMDRHQLHRPHFFTASRAGAVSFRHADSSSKYESDARVLQPAPVRTRDTALVYTPMIEIYNDALTSVLRCYAVLQHHSCVRRYYRGDINFTRGLEAIIGLVAPPPR